MKAWTIVGYDYNADRYCPNDIHRMFAQRLEGPISTYDWFTTEQLLDMVAEEMGIDRHDERSFDSAEFPKVVFASDSNSDTDQCSACGGSL